VTNVRILVIAALAWTQTLALAGSTVRVVFVRDQQIYTASEDGSAVRQLTTGGAWKKTPKWSPDGAKIAYLTAGDMGADPKSHAKIEIISADGQRVATVPVLATMTDGTEVGGMRWVDSIGWFDARHVFADGEGLNPHVGEFRTIDIATGKMGGFAEGGFETCPSKGRVAFWAPTFPPDKKMRLQVNKEDTDRFVFPDWDKLPDIHVPLLWTPACQDVALVDPRPPAALVLVGADLVVRRVPLPDWPFEDAHLSIVDHALLMRGRSKALLYDLRQDAVTEAPHALLQRVDVERAARERVVQELKGESPDWRIAPPTPEP
jgi:hypothetical protein